MVVQVLGKHMIIGYVGCYDYSQVDAFPHPGKVRYLQQTLTYDPYDGLLLHEGIAQPRHYLEGQGGFLSRRITPILHTVSLVMPILTLLLSPPDFKLNIKP